MITHEERLLCAVLRAPGLIRYSEHETPPVCTCTAFPWPHMQRVSPYCTSTTRRLSVVIVDHAHAPAEIHA